MLNGITLKCLFITTVILLTGCMTALAKKEQVHKGPFSLPATAYLALAKNQPPSEKQAMLLMAAGRMIVDNSCQEAANILEQTDELTTNQQAEKTILEAKIDLCQAKAHQAISRISSIQKDQYLQPYYQVEYHEILAQAYEKIANAALAVNERIKLEDLETDDKSRDDNRRSLWLCLAKLPKEELNTLIIESRDTATIKGWAKLALLSKEPVSTAELSQELNLWKQEYPYHPGNSLLANIQSSLKIAGASGQKNLALLLPLTGNLRGPGEAVKDGFMEAYTKANFNQNLKVQVYDTAKEDAVVLYKKALAEGATYVVGPLTKADVAKVASLDHPVPTILLNESAAATRNLYSLGLSPSHEAKEVAMKAHASGLSQALVIAPEGAWGDEIITSFRDEWERNGGQIVELMHYNDSLNLAESLRLFLHVSKQDAEPPKPDKKDKNKPVIPPEAKRRQDFDMVFLLAYPSKARQIVPLLKYYFIANAPIYATSSVYSGNTNTLRDRDLDGLSFCDIPWVFNHQLTNKNWPEQWNSYNRLYALGVESFEAIAEFKQAQEFGALGVNKAQNTLYLQKSEQLDRELVWAKFKAGTAQLINERIPLASNESPRRRPRGP